MDFCRRNVSFILAVLTSGGSAIAASTPATSNDLRGMASLVCSGVLVQLNRTTEQPAVLLTNGHCARLKLIDSGEVIMGGRYERSDITIEVGGETPLSVKSTRILYATMTGTDLALIELSSSYQDLEARGAVIYELSDSDAKPDSTIELISGYRQEKQTCQVSHTVTELMEDAWTYRDAIALSDECKTQGGWFGTPLIDPATRKIVGILNSSNTTGGLCTLDNPCEVLSDKTRMAFHQRSYAQRTSPILACLTPTGEVDLKRTGCKLQAAAELPATEKPVTSSTPVAKIKVAPAAPAKKSSWPSMRIKR